MSHEAPEKSDLDPREVCLGALWADVNRLRLESERHFLVAGTRIRASFACEQLAERYCRALRHLEIPRGSSLQGVTEGLGDLDIVVAGGALSPHLRKFLATVHVTDRINGGGVFLKNGQVLGLLETGQGIRGVQLLWPRERRAFVWTDLASREPLSLLNDTFTSPFRAIFGWFFATQGMLLLHAGAVADGSGTIVLAGRSGSGKSSTAAGFLSAPAGFLGDDSVIISCRREATVHSVYSSLRLSAEDVTRNPLLRECRDHTCLSPSGKHSFFLFPRLADRLALERPLRAFVLPSVSDNDEAELESMTPEAMLCAIAPDTLLRLPGQGQRDLGVLAAVVRQTPCYRLLLGQRRESGAEQLLCLLRQANQETAAAS